VRHVIVPPELEGPLDRAVRGLFPPLEKGFRAASPQVTSWGIARGWIATGKVRVGGELVTEPTQRVRAGAQVTLDEKARRPRFQELRDDEVVYVDAHLVVIAKPPGLSTIPYAADDSREPPADTLDARVRDWLGRRDRRGRRGERDTAGRSARPNLGVVHRLDKETSGLIVFTRTWLAKESLARQFRSHTVHRRYFAIAHGDVASATIRSFLVEDRGDGLRGSARGKGGGHGGHVARPRPTGPPGARLAVTHVERLESFGLATLVACRLETGRTHQIRIHLTEAGHPLLGERVYVRRSAAASVASVRAQAPAVPRLMLHAGELGFVHPATEREVRWEVPLPEDMTTVLAGLRR
jgi:23S rRNA pseudouridine1911/1915/1917 synthase